MKPSDVNSRIEAVIEAGAPALNAEIQKLLDDAGAGIKSIAFELFNDHWDIQGKVSDGTDVTESYFFEDAGSPYAALGEMLETLAAGDEPVVQKDFVSANKAVQKALFDTLSEAIKASKVKFQNAWAWVEDDEKAMNLPWKLDQAALQAELDRYFDFAKAQVAGARVHLTDVFKKYQSSHEAPKALFIDLQLQLLMPEPRLYLWPVPAKYSENKGFPNGETGEISMGETNPLFALSAVTNAMFTTLDRDKETRLGRDLSHAWSDLAVEWATKRMIRQAWLDAGGEKWGAPVFMRHSYNNQWIDLEAPEKYKDFTTLKSEAKR